MRNERVAGCDGCLRTRSPTVPLQTPTVSITGPRRSLSPHRTQAPSTGGPSRRSSRGGGSLCSQFSPFPSCAFSSRFEPEIFSKSPKARGFFCRNSETIRTIIVRTFSTSLGTADSPLPPFWKIVRTPKYRNSFGTRHAHVCLTVCPSVPLPDDRRMLT